MNKPGEYRWKEKIRIGGVLFRTVYEDYQNPKTILQENWVMEIRAEEVLFRKVNVNLGGPRIFWPPKIFAVD